MFEIPVIETLNLELNGFAYRQLSIGLDVAEVRVEAGPVVRREKHPEVPARAVRGCTRRRALLRRHHPRHHLPGRGPRAAY